MKSVLLLRGINVGGTGRLPMAELRAILERLGAGHVQSYIQTGNVVMTAPPSVDAIAAEIERAKGFRPSCLLIGASAFAAALRNDPFASARKTPRLLHYFFCRDDPKPARDRLDALLGGQERYAIIGRVMYLHAPDGVGNSRFAKGAEKHLGTAATARNFATVDRLREMLGAP